MTKLINDEGINQYSTVRKAYERARTLLQNENPDRKELSDLLDVLDKNPEGAKWLEAEVGEEYGKICKYVPAEKQDLVTPAARSAHSIFKENRRNTSGEISRDEIFTIAYVMAGTTAMLFVVSYLNCGVF
ncbi:MAG: hypothetical protein WC852_03500 [Candidatus Nanoarchaeia archaeon]|jgi:hypothetical protein